MVGVNPGNPEAEVSSCGFFPHGVAGGMLAYLTESQTLIPNRRVAVATDPHARGWFMMNYSQLFVGVWCRKWSSTIWRGRSEVDEAEARHNMLCPNRTRSQQPR